MNKSIIILAAGPPKKNRNRHLEVFDSRILISKVIDSCSFKNLKTYITLNKNDIITQKFVKKNHSGVIILIPKDENWISTMEIILQNTNDKDVILVLGDEIELKKKYIQDFIDTKFRFSLNKLKYPWGPKVIKSPSGKYEQNGDIALDIILIGKEYKYLLSDKNIIEKTKTMAMDWGVNNMDTGLWGGFHMLTIRNYLSNIVEYIYRNEDEKGQDND